MTNESFDRGMAELVANWPDRKPTEMTFAVYREALDEMSDSVFEAAVMACIRGCKFFPVPAEIREKALEVLGAAGQLPPDGEAAWETVLASLKNYSTEHGWAGPWRDGLRLYDGECPLSDEVMAAVNAAGGLRRIATCDMHELAFCRRDFLASYDARRQRTLATGALASRHERLVLKEVV